MLRRKYKRLLGSSRGGHFREPKKRFLFSNNRRQSVRFRGRYAKSVLQRTGSFVWKAGQILFVLGVAVWCGATALHFFRHSHAFKIKDIVYRGDVPEALSTFLPVKPGQNIFSLQPDQLEAEAINQFKELKRVSIRRTLTRNVVVTANARVPVAVTEERGRREGVDLDGVIFRLDPSLISPDQKWPLLNAPTAASRILIVKALKAWEEETPEFYSLVESVETDNMSSLTVGLKEDVRVMWGPFDEKNVIEKAKNILRLRELYAPGRAPATLRFVDQDRIVMNPNWVRATPK